MKLIGAIFVGLLAMAALGVAPARSGGSAPPYVGAAVLGRSGSIRGVVLCGEGEGEAEGGEATTPAPREWSTVWVQGLGFSARTDEQGRFRIDYVPAGTYTLGIQTAGMPIRAEFEVTVLAGAVSDVGELTVSGGCGQCGGEGHEGGTGGHEGGMGGSEGHEGGASSPSPAGTEQDDLGVEGCCSAA